MGKVGGKHTGKPGAVDGDRVPTLGLPPGNRNSR